MNRFDPESLLDPTDNTEDVSDGSADASSQINSMNYLSRKTSSVISANSGTQKSSRGRQDRDKKVVVGMASVLQQGDSENVELRATVEEAERKARQNIASNPFYLALTGNYASMKVFLLYLVTLETLFTCFATVGVMLIWYYQKVSDWDGASPCGNLYDKFFFFLMVLGELCDDAPQLLHQYNVLTRDFLVSKERQLRQMEWRWAQLVVTWLW